MPPLSSSSQPITNSPKRKRAQIPPTPPSSSPHSTMRLNTSIPASASDRAGSPRTKVAYHFQGLQLEDVSKLDFSSAQRPNNTTMLEDDELSVRKRVKMLAQPEPEIPETPDMRPSKSFNIIIPGTRNVDPIIAEKARAVVLHNDVDPTMAFTSGSSPSKRKPRRSSSPKPNSSSKSTSKSNPESKPLPPPPETKPLPPKKRPSTPPLTATLTQPFSPDTVAISLSPSSSTPNNTSSNPNPHTWQPTEITPNDLDPDDDGEGLNGIGFKPTPAEAYARAQKRRMQMEGYRTREAREARARRSERRRGEEKAEKEREREKEGERRVRFAVGVEVEGERRVGVEV